MGGKGPCKSGFAKTMPTGLMQSPLWDAPMAERTLFDLPWRVSILVSIVLHRA
jgi:hypothetical protein